MSHGIIKDGTYFKSEKDKIIEQIETILDTCIFTALDAEMHSTATSVATDQIMQLIDSAITEAQQERIKRNKSFCGCPMCTHHSEPYEAQLKNNTTKQEKK